MRYSGRQLICLLHVVLPTLKTLRYCDSNIPAMDKIYFLMKQADEALLDSQLLLDNQDLFESMRGVILSVYEEELDDFFDEAITERNDECLR